MARNILNISVTLDTSHALKSASPIPDSAKQARSDEYGGDVSGHAFQR